MRFIFMKEILKVLPLSTVFWKTLYMGEAKQLCINVREMGYNLKYKN